jgi:uncharacterized radical SAM superfamily Fe-S cluster-containing enzyme
MWERFERWEHIGAGVSNPAIKKPMRSVRCPKDCGLCKLHSSHTALANIVVTNRCDLQCFYCFFFAKRMGYVYEPKLEKIKEMIQNLRNEKPVATNAIQLTGGEPLLRDDILDIIRACREAGFDHVQLNTNGIRLATQPELAKAVREAGVNTLYLSFDGTTPQSNPKNHWEIPRILNACRQNGMGVVLVPTVIRGVNDQEVGKILRFGLKHMDVVRGVNYQPVSLVGRITRADVKKFRITIPDVIERICEELPEISPDDFYPVPTVAAISRFVASFTGKPQYDLSAHQHCGAATYLFVGDDGKIVPITRFVDVEGLLEYLNEKADELDQGKPRWWVGLKTLIKLRSFIDRSQQPAGLDLWKLLTAILRKKDYAALGRLHHSSLFVGMMHFMDLWNYDIERVKRCCIHYAQPDGRIVPFCAFNVIPQWYRDKIQKEYSLSIKKWEKLTGKKLSEDFYKRDAAGLAAEQIYKSTYEGFVDQNNQEQNQTRVTLRVSTEAIPESDLS